MGISSLSRGISRYSKNRGRLIRYSRSRDSRMLNINIRTKPTLIKLLRRKLIV